MSTDVTGWCETDRHDSCDGTLRTGTGSHWWCACTCHPAVPSPIGDGPGIPAALDTLRAARASLAGDDGQENTDG